MVCFHQQTFDSIDDIFHQTFYDCISCYSQQFMSKNLFFSFLINTYLLNGAGKGSANIDAKENKIFDRSVDDGERDNTE